MDCSPLGLKSDDLTSVSTKLGKILGLSENLKKSCRTYGTEIVFIDWHSELNIAFFYLILVGPLVTIESEKMTASLPDTPKIVVREDLITDLLTLVVVVKSKYFMSYFLQNREIIMMMIFASE